jgi:hypothetical protein
MVVAVRPIEAVPPAKRDGIPGQASDADANIHHCSHAGGAVLGDAPAQRLVGLRAVFTTAATPIGDIVIDAAAHPPVIRPERAAIRREWMRRHIRGPPPPATECIGPPFQLPRLHRIVAVGLQPRNDRRATQPCRYLRGQEQQIRYSTQASDHPGVLHPVVVVTVHARGIRANARHGCRPALVPCADREVTSLREFREIVMKEEQGSTVSTGTWGQRCAGGG